MSNRLKYLLIAIAASLMMWASLLAGTVWILSDGTDYGFTAGTK